MVQPAQHARREDQHSESLLVFASQSSLDSVQIAFLSTQEKQLYDSTPTRNGEQYESDLH